MTPEQAKKHVDDWARDKPHWEDVRNLAGHLIHAEIFGKAHKQPTGTNYLRGNDIDLDRLYADLLKFHPAVLAKLEKRQRPQKPKAEPVRNSNAKPRPSHQRQHKPSARQDHREAATRVCSRQHQSRPCSSKGAVKWSPKQTFCQRFPNMRRRPRFRRFGNIPMRFCIQRTSRRFTSRGRAQCKSRTQ